MWSAVSDAIWVMRSVFSSGKEKNLRFVKGSRALRYLRELRRSAEDIQGR